jgi:hypothetical protein
MGTLNRIQAKFVDRLVVIQYVLLRFNVAIGMRREREGSMLSEENLILTLTVIERRTYLYMVASQKALAVANMLGPEL